VVATLLLEKNTLALILTGIALLVVYLIRRQVARDKSILVKIVVLWVLCVGIQRFGVPFIFKNLLAKHQVERIYSTIGRDVPSEYMKGESPSSPGKKVVNTRIIM
jgi:rod shape determining protein RodA